MPCETYEFFNFSFVLKGDQKAKKWGEAYHHLMAFVTILRTFLFFGNSQKHNTPRGGFDNPHGVSIPAPQRGRFALSTSFFLIFFTDKKNSIFRLKIIS